MVAHEVDAMTLDHAESLRARLRAALGDLADLANATGAGVLDHAAATPPAGLLAEALAHVNVSLKHLRRLHGELDAAAGSPWVPGYLESPPARVDALERL